MFTLEGLLEPPLEWMNVQSPRDKGKTHKFPKAGGGGWGVQMLNIKGQESEQQQS